MLSHNPIQLNNPGSGLKAAKRNLISALEHPSVVNKYLEAEIQEGRVVGPFPKAALPHCHVSRFGVIPKSHQANKWRLIVDLSHPKGHSVNAGVPPELCTMTYISIDDTVRQILALGPGTQLAKIDIKSAFRLIPVHPADRHSLAMEWGGGLFVDTCLPFGLRSAPKLFNLLADLLEWVLIYQGATFLWHYLDDFLTMGPPDTPECQRNLNLLIQVCRMLDIPLAIEKVAGPTTSLDFLGILLDTVRMEARLPEDKFQRVLTAIKLWLDKKKATKREILSLVGLLQHAAKVVLPGRTFVRRMYATAAKVHELHHYTRLNVEFRSDLVWWFTFLKDWNRVSFMQLQKELPIYPEAVVQTDASGSHGCGAFCEGRWLQWKWPLEWVPLAIMVKELVPIIFSCAVWGPVLARKRVLFQCDNTGVVAAIQKGSSKDPFAMLLLRALWFFVVHYDIALSIEHIPGVKNDTADQLSRFKMESFFLSNPQACWLPTPLPAELLEIVAANSPDWTSPRFSQLFSIIISKA